MKFTKNRPIELGYRANYRLLICTTDSKSKSKHRTTSNYVGVGSLTKPWSGSLMKFNTV